MSCLKTSQADLSARIKYRLTSFCFPRSHRLLSAEDYKSVFDQNNFRASHKNILMLARLNNKTPARLGMVFGKKNIPRSVDRNRFKRITREQFRLQGNLTAGLDIVVVARAALADVNNQSYAALLRALMSDLQEQRVRKQKNDLSKT